MTTTQELTQVAQAARTYLADLQDADGQLYTDSEVAQLDDATAAWTAYSLGLPLVDMRCHRTRDHTQHLEYLDGQEFFSCPGVGHFVLDIKPPVDPFDGVDAAYENTEW